MIPVTLQDEPVDFDVKVRQPGLAWLKKHAINFGSPPPNASKLPDYWSKSNRQLWESYSGICAYLAIYFEWTTGASSTDHFIAKSKNAGEVYEWKNYRLSSLGANRNKGKFDDVLDPIGLRSETFFVDFSSGSIYPNPALPAPYLDLAKKTIARLKLDSPGNNEMRASHFWEYKNGHIDMDYLRRKSSFVHAEIIRQGLKN
jgi:hypothetical protein